ncbi:MAG: type II toxin-antitoxin system VapC family toxin [Gaiella sp.]|nr:type II toxin-antitoxin system VapC family toxin [Gaiella sp.]
MIAYLDTSALVKLFLDEDGYEVVRELWIGDTPVSTGGIGQTELACALAAAVRDRRFAPERLTEDVVDGTFLRTRAEIVTTDAEVLASASRLGVAHSLRALDAIHVASALVLRDADPVVVSWDDDQRNAARAEGLPLFPPTIRA